MARLKSPQQLELERKQQARWAIGNIELDTTKLLLIYARQSSSKQYVSNIYSAMEQRDGLLERAGELGFERDEQRILFIENQLAKKTHVSGSLRIDQRVGLSAVVEQIDPTGIIQRFLNPSNTATKNEEKVKAIARAACKTSAVLVSAVDRITRDEDLIDPDRFANICRIANVLIITDEYTFDFNNPNRDDMGKFMVEAIGAKEYVRKQIKGKMLKGRTRKASLGRVANGVAPVGLKLDENKIEGHIAKHGFNFIPSVHAPQVDWLYTRFRALGANLAALLHEVVGMAQRGIPLFPDDPSIDPKTMYLKRMEGGWTVSTRFGLQYILTNPVYAGHVVFEGRIVKRNAHAPIVNLDNWNYAFEHLSTVDLDGNPIIKPERIVRYEKQSQQGRNTALMAGVRHDGRPVIDGVNRQHVYVQLAASLSYGVYRLNNRQGFSVSGYETTIDTHILDSHVEDRLLYWLSRSERASYAGNMPHKTLSVVERQAQAQTAEDGIALDIALTSKELVSVERRLRTSEDLMDDEELRGAYESKARLRKRLAELHQIQERESRREKERQQAADDLQHAADKWASWPLEKKRQLIRLVTDSITLDELAEGWLRITIVWSELMGFIASPFSATPPSRELRAVEVGYIWRQAGSVWSEQDIATLREQYPTASRSSLLACFPSRSWNAIVRKATGLKIARAYNPSDTDIPADISLHDLDIITEFKLNSGMKVQWRHEIGYIEGDNKCWLSQTAP